MKTPNLTAIEIGVGLVAVAIGIYATKKLISAAGDAASAVVSTVGDVADATVTTATGVLTGNNIITQSARTTAYQGAGVVGTVAAATDNVSGGFFSSVGNWIGSKTYDLTH